MRKLLSKIARREAKVAVIGIGYVGLPLAVGFARAGFETVGIDLDATKVENIKKGRSYIQDIPTATIRDLVRAGKLSATTDFSVLQSVDAVSICVPTPLRKSKDPDISFILSSIEQILRYFHRGMAIVLESTTFPGTTDEVVLPLIEDETGARVGVDFFLAFSPERIDPGNAKFGLENTPKIVGGVTKACSKVALALYGTVLQKVIPVSSTKAAEMVKLLENTFRSVNIALANEVAIMCDRLGLNVWEIVEGASTKPFGFLPFWPGPGIGGHCLPIDPLYLSWKLKTLNYNSRTIQVADEINSSMPEFVVRKVVDVLNAQGKSVNGSNILVLGVAYKPDVGDTRESPALDVLGLLAGKGGCIRFHDPYVPELDLGGKKMTSVPLTPKVLSETDCAVIVAHHKKVDYARVAKFCKAIVDTRNATKHLTKDREKIVLL
jgi:UDP-N-acetyl-D-glucosamine dehydrogenase